MRVRSAVSGLRFPNEKEIVNGIDEKVVRFFFI